MSLKRALESVARRLHDPWFLALLGPDGLAIEALQFPASSGMEPEEVCVEAASLLRALAQSHDEFGDGAGVAGLSVSLGRARFELSRFDEDVYLLAVSGAGNPQARVHFELRRGTLQLSKFFD
ncbi:MAG: hypothetical protein DWQ36_00190 [Acidobacteria bacterium]|nr:MAG: hypothetical protein DWQ30_18340 [Acidobacteriota bacterium]REK12123.1 MAG: hypothetical protein DWQ36_00190 [Acidobacteriota bacterium]